MQAALFDSSVYISALRGGNEAALTLRHIASDAPLWLSSAVLEEFYAGANHRDRHVVERLERDFDKAKRILVPNLNDWTLGGKMLGRLAAKYHYKRVGQGRLTNDALIATSARRLGIRVISASERDFPKLAKFHIFQWEVVAV